jgi:hypothetical protein
VEFVGDAQLTDRLRYPASLRRVTDSAVERAAHGTVLAADRDSTAWVRELAGTGPEHDAAVARLHAMLLRISRAELSRRAARIPIIRPELDDLAHHAAGNATVTILARHHPGVAAHLAACGPCAEDLDGLLAALQDETT